MKTKTAEQKLADVNKKIEAKKKRDKDDAALAKARAELAKLTGNKGKKKS